MGSPAVQIELCDSGCAHPFLTTNTGRFVPRFLPPTFVLFFIFQTETMSIANIPFPSFTLVLTSDRVVIPGPSYVIRLAPLVVSHPQVRQAIEPANIILDDGINLNFENDSVSSYVFHFTISHFLPFYQDDTCRFRS